jgi:tetratricopeptide (TPR) repeat protein
MAAQQDHAAKQSDNSPSPPKETPAAWFEAGLRLLQAGQLAQAEQCGRSALALDEAHADSLHLMGQLCAAARRDDLAVEWFARAIRQNSAVTDYFAHLGMALQRQNRLDDAIKCFDRTLLLDPGQAEIWCRMGEVLQQQNRPDEAIMSFDQALTVKPDYREAANAGALLYFKSGRYEAALARFTQSAGIDPTQAGAFNFISMCQWPLRRYDEALANGHKALALAPKQPEIHKNIGLILQKLDRQEEALTWFYSAIALRPDFPPALNDRATTLFALRRIDEAFADIDRAITLDPECADYHWNRALLYLLVGRFDEGWPAREWGRKCALVGFVDRKFTQPRWFGDAPIAGKTILLHSDEGLGDTIQFCRYATEVARLGARVILEVEASLHPLLTGIDGVSLCLPKLTDVPLPDFDPHCPLSGLPLAFKTRLETIPAARAYLPPLPEARLREWRERLGAHDRLRVGLVWSGNPSHANDRNRSMTLQRMLSILHERASFYSLQKEPRDEDRATLAARADIIDFTGYLTDFVETAALISCLDLVVTVDTSVAHLAAALGRPTWILLPHTPDYRWLLDRDDSPWYPSARLFRQGANRDYSAVLTRVRGELQVPIAERSTRHGRA